jgi:hypothetical protein
VKFSFFHLMPYPYLPDDFDEKYDSSAPTYPNANFDGAGEPDRHPGNPPRVAEEIAMLDLPSGGRYVRSLAGSGS